MACLVGARCGSNSFLHIHLIRTTSQRDSASIINLAADGKMREREVQLFAKGHTAWKRGGRFWCQATEHHRPCSSRLCTQPLLVAARQQPFKKDCFRARLRGWKTRCYNPLKLNSQFLQSFILLSFESCDEARHSNHAPWTVPLTCLNLCFSSPAEWHWRSLLLRAAEESMREYVERPQYIICHVTGSP